ncbi:MAG: hypothetical protein QXY07_04150, partial [Candidatus Bathyarchaeia archaeon]
MMKAVVIPTLFGVLAFDESSRLIAHSLFPKKPEDAAKTILEVESGKMVKEVADLIAHLKGRGYTDFVFENAALAAEVRGKFAVSTEFIKVSEAGQLLRSNIESYAIDTGFVRDYDEFQRWMHSVSLEIAKLKVKGAVEKRDLLVA